MLKQLTTVMLAASLTTHVFGFEGIYGYVGAGYKVDEPDFGNVQTGRNPSARFGIFGKWGRIKAGIDHHSQWRDGFPFNERQEYHKTELFVDYELCLLRCKGGRR